MHADAQNVTVLCLTGGREHPGKEKCFTAINVK
jgi:hypothetical protein